jgi:hypothetical protein
MTETLDALEHSKKMGSAYITLITDKSSQN